MNALTKVIVADLMAILFSAGVNYIIYFKILLAGSFRLTRQKFVWIGAGWLMLYWYLLFYLLVCIKQYVCPAEFYDRSIQVLAFVGLYIEMSITGVIAVSAVSRRKLSP